MISRVSQPDVTQLTLMADVMAQTALKRVGNAQQQLMPEPVCIKSLILHELNHREKRLGLVDEIAVLSTDDAKYFASHIEYARDRAEWDAAFLNSDGDIPALCHQLLNSTDDFISASQSLARHLYDQMRTDSIVPGDFVVVLYLLGASPIRHIALLKLDPDKRKTRTFHESAGKRRVNISEAKNILPETKALHKCALISPDSGYPDSFTVRLLDTQARPSADPVAAFFYRGFLTTDLMLSSRRRTRDFIHNTDTWINWHSLELTPEELLQFYEARREHLSRDEINIPEFAGSALPNQATLSSELTIHLTNTVLPKAANESAHIAQFAVDHKLAKQLTQNVSIEIDGGGRLVIPADRFNDIVHVDTERTVENRTRIVIETQIFREVFDR